MKKLSMIILMSLALLLLGCGEIDYGDSSPYDRGYEEGYEKALSESTEYVHKSFTVDEIYFQDEILDYVTENCDIEDVYDLDTLIEYLEGLDYAVIPVEDYDDLISNQPSKTLSYVGNNNTMKFHKSTCSSVLDIKESNKVFESREYFIENGYKPCGKCNP